MTNESLFQPVRTRRGFEAVCDRIREQLMSGELKPGDQLPGERELAAMRTCLKAFGAAAEEIGFDKPLGAYSEAEALQVVDAIVTCYTGSPRFQCNK